MNSFSREKFFPIKRNLDLNEIESLIKNLLIKSKLNNNFEIKDVSSLNNLIKNSILFLNDNLLNIKQSKEDICVITDSENIFESDFKNIFLVNDLSYSYNLILNEIFSHEDQVSYQDDFYFINGSYFSKYSNISPDAKIGKNCLIGRGVEIGKNCIIKNNVIIKNSIIKSNVVICDNTCIGTTGFGFDFKKRGSNNLNPQIGVVFIDDFCHIGSSCTIDRGKIDMTYIGKNCMIDNLVHIGHNVVISDNACIAAQTGISGSVKIGSFVTIGGQSGIAGHLNIGDFVTIAARSGVTKSIKNNSTVAGFPATDIRIWKKTIINERRNRYK